jgi:protocatechuate 3,4-dioxygenase beta subunit
MKLISKTLPFLVVAMLFAIPAFSQTGTLTGKATDADGKPITGATVSIERQGVNGHYETKTDNKGQYVHAGLPTGGYKLTLMKDGKPTEGRRR